MTNQIRPYEPLTSESAALVLVDHQVGLMTGVRDYSTGELKHNVVALARAAKGLKLPIVVTTTARDSMWGPTFPELVEALPGIEITDRSSVNAFDDSRVARAIEATGRRKLIFAGIALEVCAAFPAITAVGKGWTRMWRLTPLERSARPSGKWGSCACCRRASCCPTTQP
jgi:nicotinamidase-related amidase